MPEPAVPLPGSHPFYAVVVSDCGDGTPAILETLLADGSLQAALLRADRIGSRYGMTRIAECRIIPELTHDA